VPPTKVIIYQEKDGKVPLLEWLDQLRAGVVAKCKEKIQRLRDMGHELRRPEADYLRDGIYELRVRVERIHYRILYFFHGQNAVVISHGLVREDIVPPKEIDKAIKHKELFECNQFRHTYKELWL
jgi:phage-related protein